ncbi:MAG: transposase [Brasilonema angustatum HA4187-MV1]|nr:transposase [Brasilonema angustatum HA4187-MV1]
MQGCFNKNFVHIVHIIDQRNTSKTCHYCRQRQDMLLEKYACFCSVCTVIDRDANNI